MGIFGKLQFWKKSDDFDLGGDLGKDLGNDLNKDMPLGGDFSPNSQGFGDAWNAGQGLDSPPQFGQPPYGQQSFGQPQSTSFGQSSSPSFGQQPASAQFGQQKSQPSFQQQSFQSPSFSQPSYSSASYAPASPPPHDADYLNSKNLEVISSKLDALRAAMESMNARLANIERIAGQEEDNRRKRYY